MLLAVTSLGACVLRYVFHLVSIHRILGHVPGPKRSSLVWGEEWALYHSRPGSHYVEWHKKFGKVLKFTGAFGHQVLSITDPQAITFIVGEGTYNFPKPAGVREWFKATLGEGILWVEGKSAHEKQRRSLAPALSQHSVRNLTPVFYETSAKLAAQWGKQIDESTSNQAEIEVTNWAGRFALDTVGRAAFSYDFNCLSGEPHPLADALDGLTNNENKLSSFYMRALFWLFPSILSIGKKGEMIRRSKHELGEIAVKMWKDAKIAGDMSEKNLMAMMLKADASGLTFQDEAHLVAQMRTVISAGYETVSSVVSWVLYELSTNTSIQDRVREEISTAGDPSFDEFNTKFPILDAVIHETLRLHPPILENHHQAAETVSIPLSEPIGRTSDLHLVIPKGTILEIPVNVVQTDPAIWGPDADIFRPDRWLERRQSGIQNKRDLFAFSEGPRACIGKAFALCELKVLLVTLLRQFSWTCPYDIEPFQSFVIRPRIKGQGPSSLPLLVSRI
ncbi:cytochrome P450 [Dendrothele bispora CBS 962.96]|uniref:Cytochrome P450 n=1 Tax=Dendrothele bispora (strain CBS 962.96) TaxID=1314807 RepID=A0A4V4HEM5_DENBC|nr:cytochrome P450 [Dendrothele bispora CBS 962.96]